MTAKVFVVVLALMLLAGMVGRSLGIRGARRPKTPPIETARKCPTCGAYLIGAAECDSPGCARS